MKTHKYIRQAQYRQGLIGIVLIIIIAVLVGGAAYIAYDIGYEKAQENNQENPTQVNSLTEEKIIEAIELSTGRSFEKMETGGYEATNPEDGLHTITSITKGDLNGDGQEDAFITQRTCGGSCGQTFLVALNQGENPLRLIYVVLENYEAGGAGQYGIKDIQIINGVISIKADIHQYDGSSKPWEGYYKFQDEKLVLTEAPPIITSITPNRGPKGTVVEIRGSGLSGFEGDLDVYFERSDGKRVMLTDTSSYIKTGGTLIKVIVSEPCKEGEMVIGRYSGIESPCKFVALTPGVYKVYAEPWGNKSNEVEFTVTQ
jgi:hypothetical protein